MGALFDTWVKKYDAWFETPIGRVIKEVETDLVLRMLKPRSGERILDAGCGTGIFTKDIMGRGAETVGLELSLPMLQEAGRRMTQGPFEMVRGDMRVLPFRENAFDKVVSVTALEFIRQGERAVREMFRVVKPGGVVVVATLNSLSAWAAGRKKKAEKGHSLFKHAVFRSPEELKAMAPVSCEIRTAIHFGKHEDPEKAWTIEEKGRLEGLHTGAFLVARWEKALKS